jgi:fucose permease
MMIESFGWRAALVANGSITLGAIFLMTVLIIRNFPRGNEAGYNREFDVGDNVTPDDADEKTDGKTEDEAAWTYGELLRSRNFWGLTLGIGLLVGSDQSMVTAQIPYFLEIGIDMQAAALIVSCMTASAICGKLLVGYLADKIDLRFVFYFIASIHIALLLVYITQPGYWALLLLATLFGVGIGGVFPVWSTMLAWLFGTKSYGTVMGAMTIITKGMAIVAVRFIGEVYDTTGSYIPGFVVFIGAVMVAMILAAMLKPEKKRRISNSMLET